MPDGINPVHIPRAISLEKRLAARRKILARAYESGVPHDPAAGEKSLAMIEWVRDNCSEEEWDIMYANRKIPV